MNEHVTRLARQKQCGTVVRPSTRSACGPSDRHGRLPTVSAFPPLRFSPLATRTPLRPAFLSRLLTLGPPRSLSDNRIPQQHTLTGVLQHGCSSRFPIPCQHMPQQPQRSLSMMRANLRMIRVSQSCRLVATKQLAHDCALDALTLQVTSAVGRTSSIVIVDRIH